MYISPPVTESTLLQHIVTRLFVICITKPAVPRLTIFFAYPIHSDNSFFLIKCILSSDLRVRKYNTNMAEKLCDITVAIAAPLTPKLKKNINNGSNMRFITAPIATDVIPTVEYPCALIYGLSPTANIEGRVPIRYIIIYG